MFKNGELRDGFVAWVALNLTCGLPSPPPPERGGMFGAGRHAPGTVDEVVLRCDLHLSDLHVQELQAAAGDDMQKGFGGGNKDCIEPSRSRVGEWGGRQRGSPGVYTSVSMRLEACRC